MGRMEGGELPVLTPLTLIYLSLGTKCLNTLSTLAPGGIVCHLSEHLKQSLAAEEEQVVCVTKHYRSSTRKTNMPHPQRTEARRRLY